MTSPRTSPLHELHLAHDGRMVEFAGWSLPVQFAGVLAEHNHTRSAASLFDCSHMGRLRITGPAAADALDGALTQHASALRNGRGKYGFILNDAGGVIDDTILMRLGDEAFLLVVNAATAESDRAELQRRLAGRAELTVETGAKIDLQGPASRDVLREVLGESIDPLGYFGCAVMEVESARAVVSRTGYTGELGYELFVPGEVAVTLAERLLADDRVAPAGLGARDSLRLEMGYPLYGHELSESITPLEAGLAAMLDLDREYPGAAALREQASPGPKRLLVGLRTHQRRQIKPGHVVRIDGEPVGEVSSGVFSPSLGEAVGLAFIEADRSQVGSACVVDTGRAEIEAEITELPFYRQGTCRD